MLLISCQHNQKFPFLLFPLKSPAVLIMLAQSGKTMAGFCLRGAYLCSCEEGIRYFIVSMETLAKDSEKPASFYIPSSLGTLSSDLIFFIVNGLCSVLQ